MAVKLKGKPNELFCCCGTFRGLQANESFVLDFLSGWVIGGIQLTEILLSSSLLAIV